MKSEILRKNNGFTNTDIIISVVIIILFMSVITTSFYNYYASIQSKNRQTIATNIAIDIIENIEIIEYEDITQDRIDNLVQELKDNGTIQNTYDVGVTITKYNEQSGNEQKMDLIKILNIEVEYESNKKQEKFEVTKLITK